jgi:hypothetical protein
MSGRAAGSVSAFPGADVHELLGVELRGDGGCATVPVVLPLTDPRINTGIAGGKAIDWLVPVAIGAVVVVILSGVVIAAFGLARGGGFVNMPVLGGVTLSTEGEIATMVAEQFTEVPGTVGSSASGTGAKVVAGAPGTVAGEKRLENGPGPVRGDETIAPGVVASPIAVVPTVETCARLLLPPSRSRVAVAQRITRIQICSSIGGQTWS